VVGTDGGSTKPLASEGALRCYTAEADSVRRGHYMLFDDAANDRCSSAQGLRTRWSLGAYIPEHHQCGFKRALTAEPRGAAFDFVAALSSASKVARGPLWIVVAAMTRSPACAPVLEPCLAEFP